MKQMLYIGFAISVLTVSACSNRQANNQAGTIETDSMPTAIFSEDIEVAPLDTIVNYTAPIPDTDASIDLYLNILQDSIAGSFCYNHDWEYPTEITGIYSEGKVRLYYQTDETYDRLLFLEGCIKKDTLTATWYYYEGDILIKQPLIFSPLSDEMIGQIETQRRIEAWEAEAQENQRRIEAERNRKVRQSQLHMFRCTHCGTIEYTERSTDRPKQSNEYCDRQKGITFHNWQWVKRVY